MILGLKHILTFSVIILFIVSLLLSRSSVRYYVLFVLVFLPFMDLNLTPEEYGAISVFDFISWSILFFTIDRFFYFSGTRAGILFIILCCLLFLGSITSEFARNSIINFFKFFSIFIYGKILIDECTKDPEFIRLIIRALKAVGILSLVFLGFQMISGISFTFYSEIHPNIYIDVIRYPSFFQDPQKYAQYLSMVSFLFLMRGENNRKAGLVNISIFIVVVLALLSTGSRLALFGLCFGIIILLLSMKGRMRFLAIAACVAGYFIIMKYADSFSFFNRMEDYGSSIQARLQIWQENMEIFYANPLLGIGIGNHHDFILGHSNAGYYLINNERVFYGTENGYLQVLIEFGLIGFLIFLLILISPVVSALKVLKLTRQFNIAVLIASIFSWMIAWMTVNSLSDRRILIVVGTLISMLIISKTRSDAIHS